jgi:uncharacterized protein (DUF427 family)
MQQHLDREARPIKIPDPDHPFTIVCSDKRIVVTVVGWVVGDSRNALKLD